MSISSNPIRSRTGKRRFALNLLTILGGLAIGLLLVEVALRIIGFRYLNLYQDDAYVGYALRPGAEGWWRKEGEAYIRVNSDGLRDREHSPGKQPDSLRIAILGDSFAEALQVPRENAFWAVAEQRLQACPELQGQKIEAINFGVSGFSTARELITLRQRVWKYSPDIVVLLVTTGNDIKDNSPLLNQYAGLPLPYFAYKNGALVLDDSLLRAREKSLRFRLQRSFLGNALDWLRDHLRLVGLIDEARGAWQNRGPKQSTASVRFGNEPGLESKVYIQPTDPVWEEAWRVTEGLIVLMRDEVKAHGAQFLIVTASHSIQVYPHPKVREEFMRHLGVDDLFYADRRIKALGDREGIEVLNLASDLQAYADQNQAILHGKDGSGHWNVLGHRLVGERVAEKLCARPKS
jgi:hypothetical protein